VALLALVLASSAALTTVTAILGACFGSYRVSIWPSELSQVFSQYCQYDCRQRMLLLTCA
jgi:hypothetical protein